MKIFGLEITRATPAQPAPPAKTRTIKGGAPRRSMIAAAATSRLNASQKEDLGGPNSTIYLSLEKTRARSRYMENSNPHANRFFNLVERNVIGPTGIRCKPAVLLGDKPDEATNAIIKKAWDEWIKPGCETTGKLSFRHANALSIRTAARDGELLIRKHFDAKRGLVIELIDPDRLDIRHNVPRGTHQNKIVMGVEVDSANRPVAYHLWEESPRDLIAFTGARYGNRERVPASDIYHLFLPQRIGSMRGLPWMASAMGDIYQIDEYRTSEVLAAREGANKGGFYIPPANEWGGGDAGGGAPPEDYEEGETGADSGQAVQEYDLSMETQPGVNQQLPPGWDYKEYNPDHPSGNFQPFIGAAYHCVAAGLDVAYGSLTTDLSDANYGSMRVGLLDERDMWKTLQRWFIEQFIQPFFQDWIDAQILIGALPFSFLDRERLYRCLWNARTWAWIDPLKDASAAEMQIAAGLASRTDIITEATGKDFENIVIDNANEQKIMEKHGVTSFPNTKTPAAPPADEPPAKKGAK